MNDLPHRLVKTFAQLYEELGDRGITVTKELTKKHETVRKMTLGEAVAYYHEEEPRGEYVLILAGKDEKELKEEIKEGWNNLSIDEHMALYLDKGMAQKAAMKQVAKDRGVSKRDIYSQIHM